MGWPGPVPSTPAYLALLEAHVGKNLEQQRMAPRLETDRVYASSASEYVIVKCQPQQVLLSPSEIRVMAFVAAGLSDDEIANALDGSVGSVRYAIRQALTKLGARNRPQAVTRMAANGLLNPTVD
jgi:DNA-binding CsgD family transcriptional regulator